LTPGALQDARHRRLAELDSQVEQLKASVEEALNSFHDAFGEVVSRPEIDPSIEGRLGEVGTRLKALKPEIEALDFDLDQSTALLSAILDVDRAMHAEQDDLDRFEETLLGIERVRQVIRDALDEFVGGTDADRRRLVRAISDSLPGIRQADLAELLGVDPRTVRRWSTELGQAEHRLVVVARLVAVLRHAWTPAGVMAWFHRPRRDLNERAPIELVSDAAAERALLSAARSSRNQYGT
jgi:hypothetical protein